MDQRKAGPDAASQVRTESVVTEGGSVILEKSTQWDGIYRSKKCRKLQQKQQRDGGLHVWLRYLQPQNATII